MAEAKAALDLIKTDAQLTAGGLIAAKEAAKNELDGCKNPADFREEEQAVLAATVALGKSAIDAASDIDGVNKALSEAKAALYLIKTDAQLTAGGSWLRPRRRPKRS